MNNLPPTDNLDNSSEVFSHSPYTIDLFDMRDVAQIKIYMDSVKALPLTMYKIMMDEKTGIVLNKTIGDEFGLSEDQCKELTRIVRDVLLSKLYVGDLVGEIAKRLGVAPDVAQKIANELVAKVFKSAMDDIKALQVANFGDRIGKPSGNNVLNLKAR